MGVASRHLEDLTHDVFVVVYRKLDDYDPSRPLRPWLFGIAYRVALDHKRKFSTHREIPDDEAGVGLAEDSGGATARRRSAKEAVRVALEALPLERRVVFILHELDGHPVADIAREFDLPLHTVYSRLKKAHKEFTEAIRSLRQPEEVAS